MVRNPGLFVVHTFLFDVLQFCCALVSFSSLLVLLKQ